MITVERTVRSHTPAPVVFPYLVDFRNAVEWDSGTVSCERMSGDGGVGTRYRNVSRFVGSTVTLDYVVEEVAEPVFRITGHTDTTVSRDTVTVRDLGEGCEVVYRAQFELSGLVRLVEPLLKPLFTRLADETEKTLQRAVDGLASGR